MKTPLPSPELQPWDQPGWLSLDAPSFLANVERAGSADVLIDLRSSLLEKVWRTLEGDLRRLGCSGYLAGGPLFARFDPSEPEGWEKILAPPYPASRLEEALRAGFSMVVGHASEAIILSNAAQSLDQRCSILVRLRHPDLMADPGPTGFLSILETLPQLPMLELKGFFLDQAFASRQECDTFVRAVSRCTGETRPLFLIGGDGGPLPQRMPVRRCLGSNLLGLSDRSGKELWHASLSLEAWGVPLAVKEHILLVGVEIGHAWGVPLQASPQLYVEGVPARLIRVEDWRSVLEIAERPEVPAPWRVLLLGAASSAGIPDSSATVIPGDWPAGSLWPMLETLAREIPLLIRNTRR